MKVILTNEKIILEAINNAIMQSKKMDFMSSTTINCEQKEHIMARLILSSIETESKDQTNEMILTEIMSAIRSAIHSNYK